MKRRIKMSIGVGAPSIIMILVVLVLVVLTMLTMSTVQAEERLIQKQISSAESINKIECQAQQTLCKIDKVLYETYLSCTGAKMQDQCGESLLYKKSIHEALSDIAGITVYEEKDQIKVYYEVSISKQVLQVELIVILNPSINSPLYYISQWCIKPTKVEYELDGPEFGEIMIP